MSKLDEKEIIKIFQNHLGNKKFVSEDVEVFKIGNVSCVVKVDTLVQSTDIPPRTKLRDAARKSVIACISDFAAKGVKPLCGIISITIPRQFSNSQIIDLSSGFAQASKEFDFRILGGDTNEGKELVIQVCLFGKTKGIVPRNGAKIGDLIFVTGPFGYSIAGLQIMLWKKRGKKQFVRKAKAATLHPNPRLRFGLSCRDFFSSAMDSSDGLSTTLHEMSRQSKRKFVITNIPAKIDLVEFSKSNRLNSNDLIFNGGEEYEIVFTTSPKNRKKVVRNAKTQKVPLIEIGYVSKGKGVFYYQDGQVSKIKDAGWRHFKG